MVKKLIKAKKIPDFDKMTPEQEERWWETHDVTDLLRNSEPMQLQKRTDQDFKIYIYVN